MQVLLDRHAGGTGIRSLVKALVGMLRGKGAVQNARPLQ